MWDYILAGAITHLFNLFSGISLIHKFDFVISSDTMSLADMNSQISLRIKTLRTILTLKGKSEKNEMMMNFQKPSQKQKVHIFFGLTQNKVKITHCGW